MSVRNAVQDSRSGFTLIELLIVIAVIAIVASIAIPNLLTSRVTANENAALGTMRSIATAAFQFKSGRYLDRDGDSNPEFGTLGEMAGTAAVRVTGEMLQPTLLSASLGYPDLLGRIERGGYMYALFLPDAAGVGQPETAGALPTVDPENAEIAWSALAWPVTHGVSGRTTFFVNHYGDILKAPRANYSGITSVPPAGAALTGVPANTIVGGQLASGAIGADGNDWMPVR